MNLDEIRKSIDETDSKLLELFSERMSLCSQVAEYKAKNNMPVFQGGREKQVLKNIEAKTEPHLRSASRLLFSQIMEISKCLQTEQLTEPLEYETEYSTIPTNQKIACPGIKGSYTEEACLRVFGKAAEIEYYDTFEQVFNAVSEGRAKYGIVPIENSTAGSVDGTYEQLSRHDMYINKRLSIPVDHVLAAKTKSCAIEKVVSHEQALHQCQGCLKELGCKTETAANTSIAARSVALSSDENAACICSEHCAGLYGLEILKRDIADSRENFTRFIVISKKLRIEENADIISVCLSLPHVTGSLYRLLTKFNYCGLNLTKIESRPMPPHIKKLAENSEKEKENFEVIFYLDFEGSLLDPSVSKLLNSLEKECVYYRFLGNYRDMDKKI